MSNPHADFTQIACHPGHSVVVEACAGSGKTWLLTARLFRLLLEGARPDQILAITFTRKAAQEMQERLFGLLRECALADEEHLRKLLLERGATPSDASLIKARALAGEVLTNSRGVTIDTFHGWFASLCQMAPLASGFSRQSEPTDQTLFWMDTAIDVFIQHLLTQPAGGLLNAFDVLAAHMDRAVMRQVLQQALSNRVACSLWLSNPEARKLEQVFGIHADQEWPVECLKNPDHLQQWQLAAQWLGMGTAKQKDTASSIESVLTRLGKGEISLQDAFDQLRAVCLTSKPDISKNFVKPTKGQLDAGLGETEYAQVLEGVALHILQALQLEKDQQDLKATQALSELIEPLFETYKSLKAEQGLCDFDDLEATALHMLMDEGQRAYMQQKLDIRVRHLLVDEFQDTNPVQWNILKLWLQDYGSDERPSVFLVGDPKQSIYRFRRAEARLFNHARQWLVEHFGAHTLESDSTRRCAMAVVEVVNQVFKPGQTRGNTAFRPHASLAEHLPANVLCGLHVYPKIPADHAGPDEAQQVVQTLQQWLKTGQISNLGEVMVLVRAHKSGLSLMAALREAGLAYTIKDTGERYTSQVWSDTIALLGVLMDPGINLHLLELLRCPLIGLSSAQFQVLIQTAEAQQMGTVWSTLEFLADSQENPWVDLHAQLVKWLSMARALPLFETLSRVVSDTQATEKYLNSASPRQRVMMAEHWDWLKAWALNLNKGRYPGVRQAYEEAVKLQTYASSDSEGAAADPNVLRILTVHSAKGLEARHVWLFDANSSPRPGGSNAGLLIDWMLGESHPQSVTVMANLNNPSPGRALAQSIEQQAYRDEEDHLLYVALTRARQSIHLSGTERRAASQGWYERLLPHATEVHAQWPAAEACADGPGQIELPGLFEPPAVWVRPQFPLLNAPGQPVGTIIPRVSTPELRMGIAWHAAMEWVDEMGHLSFEQWWSGVQLRCEQQFRLLRHSEAEEVRQVSELVLNHPPLQPWLHKAQAHGHRVFNELEWVVGEGRSLRADRVLELADHYLVLDYKWTVNETNLADYSRQVLEYVGLVDETLNLGSKPQATRAALIDRYGQVHWLTSV